MKPSDQVILLVSQDPGMQRLLESAAAGKYALVVANNAVAADRLATTRHPAVVVLDDRIEGKSAAAVLEQVSVPCPDAKALILSSGVTPDGLARFGPVLSHSCSTDQLGSVVRSLMALHLEAAEGAALLSAERFSDTAPTRARASR